MLTECKEQLTCWILLPNVSNVLKTVFVCLFVQPACTDCLFTVCFIYGCFVSGLQPTAGHFFMFLVTLFETTLVAVSLAFAVSASMRLRAVANLAISTIYSFMMVRLPCWPETECRHWPTGAFNTNIYDARVISNKNRLSASLRIFFTLIFIYLYVKVKCLIFPNTFFSLL